MKKITATNNPLNKINHHPKMNKDTSNKEMKLTKNEQKVLKHMLEKEKISDTNIAENMNISQQAVNQIRAKLETLGIIKGYSPIIDFEKIGINVIILVGIKLKHIVWEKKKEWEIVQSLKNIPYIYQAYRVVGQNISHAMLMGFENNTQRDNFIRELQTAYVEQLEIKWNYTISVKDILIQDPSSLLYQILDNKEFEVEKLFL